MPKDNRSFFERLTGSINAEEDDKMIEEEKDESFRREAVVGQKLKTAKTDWMSEDEEGQLAVDMFQTPDEIIIKSVVAGVKPDEIDVSITQDMVTIRGRRQKQHEIEGDNCFYQELYWGGFSRSILLPQEVDSEAAEATIKNGLLTVKLPKLDKNRIQKVRVKNE